MAKSDDEKDEKEEKDKDSEESEEKEEKKEEKEEGSDEPEDAKSEEVASEEESPSQSGPKPTAEELLHSELPKVSEEEGPEDHDGYSADSEEKETGNEHTLNDLASEDPATLPSGVEPSRPKSFMMDQDGPTNLNQRIPSSGVYGGGKKGSKKKTVMLLVIALLVVGAVIYLLKGRILGSNEGTSPSPSPTIAEETPTPTPTAPSIDRSKYTVDILNGSGKTGLAASVSAKLKGLGYQTGKTGNATNSAFTRTQILAKTTTPQDVVDALVKDLSPDYDATNSGVLPSSATADLEVIIGAK